MLDRNDIFFTALVFITTTTGLQVQGLIEPIAAQLGLTVVLPCSAPAAAAALDLQEVEVLWSRSDSGTIVGLFQDGESRPESQDPVYGDRAHFFPHETPKGNFSLLVENVTTGDAGVYKCVVHTNTGSDETLVEVTVERLRVTGPDKPLFTHAGGDVIVNCSVDTHVPVEELEVEWVKSDEEMLVLLFAEGENKAESQHERYRDRAEFFTDEIPKGNFSMRLRGLRTEDKGQYVCKVHTETTSANATALLQALGYSHLHILEMMLCISVIVFVILTFILSQRFKKKGEASRALVVDYLLVTIPCIMMFLAFILWGFIEGIREEVILCSRVCFTRILILFMMAPYVISIKGKLGFALKYWSIIISSSTNSGSAFAAFWIEELENEPNAAIQSLKFLAFHSGLILALLFTGLICTCRATKREGIKQGVTFGLMVSLIFICSSGLTAASSIIKLDYIILTSVTSVATIICALIAMSDKNKYCDLSLKVLLPSFFILNMVSCLLYMRLILEKDKGALLPFAEFFLITVLTALSGFQYRSDLPVKAHNMVYMSGVVGLPLVNSVALLTELILKAERGKRTVNLCLIVGPFETLLLTVWLMLLIYAYYKQTKQRTRVQLRNKITRCQNLCCPGSSSEQEQVPGEAAEMLPTTKTDERTKQ